MVKEIGEHRASVKAKIKVVKAVGEYCERLNAVPLLQMMMQVKLKKPQVKLIATVNAIPSPLLPDSPNLGPYKLFYQSAMSASIMKSRQVHDDIAETDGDEEEEETKESFSFLGQRLLIHQKVFLMSKYWQVPAKELRGSQRKSQRNAKTSPALAMDHGSSDRCGNISRESMASLDSRKMLVVKTASASSRNQRATSGSEKQNNGNDGKKTRQNKDCGMIGNEQWN
ncbi:unnamed protein product [Toxocara canis]|uniref:Adaptin_N domain-containing protein n=1 Tax=Toxocara canis TaxID=6265 RepID=A0A183UVP1_TOXCA|nr:unnamed protein product [Toxocara canis]